MLRRDFGDYLEFVQKIQEADEEKTKNSAKNVRRHAEKKIKSSCTGIHEPGFRHLRQLQYKKYNTQAAECQFRQE